MTEMFGEAWSPMSVPDLAPDDDDDDHAVSSLVLKLSHERGAKCRDQTKSNFVWAKLMVLSLLR